MLDLAALTEAPFTYTDVGATLQRRPPGYHLTHGRRVLGHGDEVYDAAARAIITWRMHRDAGLTVTTDAETVHPGAVAVVGIGVGRLRIQAPCRVVEVLWSHDVAGFAYGTLPGHPEAGEEAFWVRREPNGTVVGEVVALSQPGRWYTRVAGPFGRVVQRLACRRYLAALAKAVG